jgi:aspartyl protease family protein
MKVRHSIAVWAFLFFSAGAWAQGVALIGVIGNKAAVLSLNGGDPKTVKVGQAWNGVKVLAVENDRATVEIDGKRRVLDRAQAYSLAAPAGSRESATLSADARGHFFVEGAVNGVAQRFLVDTGASIVVLSPQDAERLALDYRSAPKAAIQTANGRTEARVVKLDRVRVGGIEVTNVDAVVVEKGGDAALLGMSFLNRVEMRRDGETMTLIRRY